MSDRAIVIGESGVAASQAGLDVAISRLLADSSDRNRNRNEQGIRPDIAIGESGAAASQARLDLAIARLLAESSDQNSNGQGFKERVDPVPAKPQKFDGGGSPGTYEPDPDEPDRRGPGGPFEELLCKPLFGTPGDCSPKK